MSDTQFTDQQITEQMSRLNGTGKDLDKLTKAERSDLQKSALSYLKSIKAENDALDLIILRGSKFTDDQIRTEMERLFTEAGYKEAKEQINKMETEDPIRFKQLKCSAITSLLGIPEKELEKIEDLEFTDDEIRTTMMQISNISKPDELDKLPDRDKSQLQKSAILVLRTKAVSRIGQRFNEDLDRKRKERQVTDTSVIRNKNLSYDPNDSINKTDEESTELSRAFEKVDDIFNTIGSSVSESEDQKIIDAMNDLKLTKDLIIQVLVKKVRDAERSFHYASNQINIPAPKTENQGS